jgi:C4-dicarboxylate-specific signal transduction histidine kinase
MEIILKDTDMMLQIDASLIEQVLINLVVNSIEAVKEVSRPKIILSAFLCFQPQDHHQSNR